MLKLKKLWGETKEKPRQNPKDQSEQNSIRIKKKKEWPKAEKDSSEKLPPGQYNATQGKTGGVSAVESRATNTAKALR